MLKASGWVSLLELAVEYCKIHPLTHHVLDLLGRCDMSTEGYMVLRFWGAYDTR
jgi:hypothetical protein